MKVAVLDIQRKEKQVRNIELSDAVFV